MRQTHRGRVFDRSRLRVALHLTGICTERNRPRFGELSGAKPNATYSGTTLTYGMYTGRGTAILHATCLLPVVGAATTLMARHTASPTIARLH